MTDFRPDTSFPFLAIARRFDIPYDSVLMVAEAIERGQIWHCTGAAMAAIRDAVESERERRLLMAG